MAEPGSSADLRPRLPWFERVGMTDGKVSAFGVVIRVAQAVLILANPLTVVLIWAELLALSRTKVRGWWLSVPAGVAFVVALLAGWIANYNAVWRELLPAAVVWIQDRDPGALADVASQWPQWVLMQLPVAVIAATLIAGLILSYRRRFYAATWRTEKAKPASAGAITRALDQLDAREPKTVVQTADELALRLGVELTTAKPFVIEGSALRMHGVVGGPTGFGKSTSIQRILDQLIAQPAGQQVRAGAVLVDMKADPGMVEFLRHLAEVTDRRFHLVTVDATTSDKWNGLHHGDAAQLKAKLIEVEANSGDGGFSEPHYRRLGERFLLVVATVLCELAAQGAVDTFDGVRRPWRKDLPDMVRLMNISKLRAQVDRLSPTTSRLVEEYAAEVETSRTLSDDVYGLYNRYALMAAGPAGEIMTASDDGLDLLEAMRNGDIVVFSLDSMGDASTARQLGNFALQEATYAFGRLAGERFAERGGMVALVTDEFSALGGSLLSSAYSRGRSAGGSVWLASQDLEGDLNAVSPEFRTQVLVNANIIVLHQQRGESPDAWAKSIGTKEVWKETLQVTADNGLLGVQEAASGVASLREAHQFVVDPDTLRNLGRGEAVVIIGHPVRRIGHVRVAAPPRRAVPERAELGAELEAGDNLAPAAPVIAVAAPESVDAPPSTPATATRTTAKPAVHDLLDDDDGHNAPVIEPED